MAVMVYLSDLDGILGPGQNLYMVLPPKGHKFVFVPWDQDHSFGQFGMRGTQEQREHLSIRKPWQGENRFLARVFKAEPFMTRYMAHMKEFSQTIFDDKRLSQQVDELAAVLKPVVAQESAENLERFEKVVAGESASRPGGFGGGRGFGGPGGFGQPTKPIKAFVKIRTPSVREQVAGTSKGEELGEFGFPGGGGGGRGPGGPGGPGGGGPGGGFGPGNFLARVLVDVLDKNHDDSVSREEFMGGFKQWFADWNKDKSGFLTEEQLRAGINKDLSPFRGGPPGGFGGGEGGGNPPPRREGDDKK
jgi:hypothetical protein